MRWFVYECLVNLVLICGTVAVRNIAGLMEYYEYSTIMSLGVASSMEPLVSIIPNMENRN